MGNNQLGNKLNFGIQEYIHEQFNRVRKNQQSHYLTISQLFEAHPHQDYPLDFKHIGILFICDQTKDGIFTIQDLKHFALWIQINLQSVQMYQFKSQLQARTVELVIEKVEQNNGQKEIIEWFVRMLLMDKEGHEEESSTFMRIQQMKVIYEVFNVKVMTSMDIQSFFYLMKRSSEDLGHPIKEIKVCEEDDQYEEYIDVTICKEFMRHFLKGVAKILKEIGYSNSVVL